MASNRDVHFVLAFEQPGGAPPIPHLLGTWINSSQAVIASQVVTLSPQNHLVATAVFGWSLTRPMVVNSTCVAAWWTGDERDLQLGERLAVRECVLKGCYQYLRYLFDGAKLGWSEQARAMGWITPEQEGWVLSGGRKEPS